jgi:serine/threonine protein kinase/WD40 repeat protein
MTADASQSHANEPDDDDAFVNDLAAFDELLRCGESSVIFDENADSSVKGGSAGALACLRLLERAFPRSTHSVKSSMPESLGRFELLRILGQGGFGVVYLAHDPRLGRLVALKVPRLHTLGSPDLYQRFLREARAAAALDHPNILPILETGEVGPVCYIVSAYCEGADLAQWIKTQAPVAPNLAARIVHTLADATHYSHSRGILHRDLKPSNVLLAAQNATGRVLADDLPFVLRLTDFGLARLTEESLGETGSAVLGTPMYMAPEQAAGQSGDISAATDVYALGAILYELLTSRAPFQGAGVLDVLNQIQLVEPVAPSRLVGSIPRDLETICLKCLRKDPRARYASAGELRDDLQRFLRCEPIRAKSVSILKRSLKWGRRHPAILLAVLVSVTAILLLIGGLAFHLYEVEGHLSIAERLRRDGLVRESALRTLVYAGEVEAASADLTAGMPEFAHRRLERFVPTEGDKTDVRGPEWHYLWRQTLPTLPARVFRGHQGAVYSVALTADGRLAISGDGAGILKVWNPLTAEVLKSFKAHEGEVRAIQFSPDGRYCATGGSFHFIRIWNTADWSLAAEFNAHDGTITSIDFSPDGERLISGGRDEEIRCWDWRRAKLLWNKNLTKTVYAVRYAHGGETIYSLHGDAYLTRWNAADGSASPAEVMGPPGDKLQAMDLPPDSRFIVGGGYRGEIACYDTQDHQQWILPVGDAIYASSCSPDGQHAAFGTGRGQIYLLKFGKNSFRGVQIRRWVGHDDHVDDVRFSPNGKELLSASLDGTVKLWNLAEVPAEVVTFLSETRAPSVYVGNISIASSAGKIVTAGAADQNGWVRVWDVAKLRDVQSFEIPNLQMYGIVADPNSERWAAFCDHRALIVWDNSEVQRVPRIVEVPGIRGLDLAPNGQTLAVAINLDEGKESAIDLYDAGSGQHLRRLCSSSGRIADVKYAPDGRTLVAGFVGSAVLIIDAESGAATAIQGTEVGGYRSRFNSTGTLLAVARPGIIGESATDEQSGSQIFLIDYETRRVVSMFRHGFFGWQTYDMAMSLDGRLLAVSSIEAAKGPGQVLLRHLATDRTLIRLSPFKIVPGSLAFLPDGKSLAATTLLISPMGRGTFLWRLGTDPQPASGHLTNQSE